MLIQSCINKQINELILSKVNTKQNTINIERIKLKLIKINWSTELITADSNDYEITEYDWLLGRILTAFWRNIVLIIDISKIKKNTLRK